MLCSHLIGRTGSTVNNYLFAGEQYDSNLGGYYLRQRYYDQYRGRFTSQDPFEGWMSDPMSLHNYLYAHGNPVNAIDPSGLSTLSMDSLLSLIATAGALVAIVPPVMNIMFTFREGTPNEFPPAPPPFPLPRPSEPEILINRPPADGFPPSPAPFPMPQPERPEPLITRVPLLGLKEYLENYVFSYYEVEWELLNSEGELKDSGIMRSGGTHPGRRLSWNEQYLVHAERKVIDSLAGRVQQGDVIKITGTKAPCSNGRGCQAAMDAFAKLYRVKVIYEKIGEPPETWEFPR